MTNSLVGRPVFEALSEDLRTSLAAFSSEFGTPGGQRAPASDQVNAAGEFLKSRLKAAPEENLTFIELMLLAARDEESRRVLSPGREAVRDFVVQLMERSSSPNPDEDTDLLMALSTGLILENLARGRPARFEKRAVALIERTMFGLVVDRESGKKQKGALD
jgi:hypothetical protein